MGLEGYLSTTYKAFLSVIVGKPKIVDWIGDSVTAVLL
jgi:hypothetical protein